MGDISPSLVRSWLERVAADTGAFTVRAFEPITGPRLAGRAADAYATVLPTNAANPVRLVLEAKSRLSTGQAIAAAHQSQAVRRNEANNIPVVCCPYISPRTAAILRDADVGYLDAAGNCRLCGPGLSVHVSGKPNPNPDTRPAVSLFAPRSSRICHVLLLEPQRPWFVQELAQQADVSLGLASRIKSKLAEEGYVEEINRTVRLRDPRGLLEAWRQAYKESATKTQVYVMTDAGDAEQRVAAWCTEKQLPYALTGFSAAWRLAPNVRYSQAAVHVFDNGSAPVIPRLLNGIAAKPAETGANLVIGVTRDLGSFLGSREINGLKVASPVLVYLDLILGSGRGEEAATAVFDKCLLPQFGAAAH